MELTDRKKKVLRSVVDLYIRTAEPVGSKAITELPDMKYSSATIRNEMADLTAMGYLEQPHTSAGRIPSAAGYRLYVDELMADYRLSMDETKSINLAIEEKMQRVDKMMEKVAKLVSQATDLPAISVASRQMGTAVKRFELIQAGSGSFILVVMLTTDEVVNKLIKLPLNVNENDLKLLSALLNGVLSGVLLTGAAVVVARAVSSLCNFFMNKKVVFQSGVKTGLALLRYYALALPMLAAQTLLTHGAYMLLGISEDAAGLRAVIYAVVMTVLYFVSYMVQQRWVFREKREDK